VDRVGVDEIMGDCGLTHGGFYSYFASKEALISAACTTAVREGASQWKQLARMLADDECWDNFAQSYLAGDLTAPVNPVCPLAILGADVARRQDTIQPSYAALIRWLIDEITEAAGFNRQYAILSIAALVGATSLAAQVGQDRALAADILNTARRALIDDRRVAT
jgi:TetR/AcrR family transcriptional repressor of nem operon